MKNTVNGAVTAKTQITDHSGGKPAKLGLSGSDSHNGNDTRRGPDGNKNRCTQGALHAVTRKASPRAPISASARNVRGIVSSSPAAIVVASTKGIAEDTAVVEGESSILEADVEDTGITESKRRGS